MPSQSRHISSVDVCFLCLVMERSTERRPPRVALAVVPSDPISRTSRCVFQSFRNCITRIAFGLGNPHPRYHDLRFVKNLRLSIAPEFGFIECKRVQELIEGVVHSGSRLCVAVCTASIDRSGPNEDRKGLASLDPNIAGLAIARTRLVSGNGEKPNSFHSRFLPVVGDVFLPPFRHALLLCQWSLVLPFLEFMGRVLARCNLCVCYDVLSVPCFPSA